MSLNIPKNTSILISRTDSIGDVILTIPLSYVLKKQFPNNKIIFLATSYTSPILQHIASIDEVIEYDKIQHLSLSQQKSLFSSYNIHTSIIAFPTFEITKFLYRLKIPYRICTSHRWYAWLYANQLVSFSRKNSNLHEAQLNFKLLKPLGITAIPTLKELQEMYVWKSIPSLPPHLLNPLDEKKFKLILHPKSKGSAREWSIENFIQLIKNLDPSKFQIIITGTKNEATYLNKLFNECPNVLNFVGQTSLSELLSLINTCDALVAASTGTLHIAAALGKLAIGLFPSIRPMDAGRWAPIGKNAMALHQNKNCKSCKHQPENCNCIQSISPHQVIDILVKHYPLKNHSVYE